MCTPVELSDPMKYGEPFLSRRMADSFGLAMLLFMSNAGDGTRISLAVVTNVYQLRTSHCVSDECEGFEGFSSTVIGKLP